MKTRTRWTLATLVVLLLPVLVLAPLTKAQAARNSPGPGLRAAVARAGRIRPMVGSQLPTTSGTAHTIGTPRMPDTPQVVLYDQYNNAGANATLSATFTDFPTFSSDLADDFVVPAGQTWTVMSVDADGVYFNGPGPALSFNVFFYANNAGLPGAQVYAALNQAVTQVGSTFTVNLTVPAVLAPGTYWVEEQANMTFNPNGEWGWTDRTVLSNSPAAWQNPGGGFGVCPSWMPKQAVCVPTASGPDQVFRLNGTSTGATTNTPTVTPTPNVTPTPTCAVTQVYTIVTQTGVTPVPGTTDIGNHCDDCTSPVTFPFPVTFYGVTYTSGLASSNGNLQLTGNTSYLGRTCPLPDPNLGASIMLYQDDLRTDGTGGGIFTATLGTSPHRQFVIEWRTTYFGRTGTSNEEIILYEDSPTITTIYGANADNAASEEIGIQAATTGPATQFSCNTASTSTGLRVDYVLICPSPTPTRTPTNTPTATPTRTNTPTNTPVPPTNTPTPTPTPACVSPCVIPPPPAPVVVTNCAAPPVTTSSSWTQINLPGSDVVLQCALTQLPGTTGVRILAHSILVDGPAGGMVNSSGTNGTQLIAGSGSGQCNSGATVDVESSSVIASNANGGLKITGCGDIVLNSSTINAGTDGTTVTSSGGRVCATGDTIGGHAVTVTASGDLTMHGTTVTVATPPDTIKLISNNGSVLAGGGVCLPNRFTGGNDSNMTATASGIVDLSYACIEIAQNITVTAGGTGFVCATDAIINVGNAEIRNDFGKSGTITMTACGGVGRIEIGNAILVDNGANGGGSDPNRVSNLNGSLATQPVNCASSTVPTCTARPLDAPNNPVSADPANRAAHNVTGAPRCDT